MKKGWVRLLLSVVFMSFGLSGILQAEDTVTIGLSVPLSGSYKDQGEDELKAYKLAIEEINSKGGVLGKKLAYVAKDSQTNADVAGKNAQDLIAQGAVMITGGSASSEAVAIAKVCQEKGVVFMAGLTHSDDTTGKDAHRHTFRWYHNAHQSAKALTPILIEKFGRNARYGYIYANYTWGTTVLNSMKKQLEAAGAKTVFEIPTPLGTKNFVNELVKAKNEKPDVLVLIQFGADMVNSLKQSYSLGLSKEMKIVVPLMELHMALAAGPEAMEGVITTYCWDHSLADKYPGSKYFVEKFEKAYNKKPGNAAATAWVDILEYADAVKRAGSFDHVAVIKALEGHRFTLLGAEEYWRDWDHQGIHPTYVVIGKKASEMKDKNDLFTVIAEKSGDEVARTREENPVQLEPLN